MDLRIRSLADLPAAVPLVAAWQDSEWGDLEPGDSVEAREERLRAQIPSDGIPLTLLALVNGVAAGSASLVPEELPEHADLAPWLSSVYVLPEYRGRGVGTALTRAVERKATDLGWPRLYLCTWTAQDFYRRLGWTPLRSFERDGVPVDIMVGGAGGMPG